MLTNLKFLNQKQNKIFGIFQWRNHYFQPNNPLSALEKQNQHSEIVIGHTILLKLFDHKLTETVLGITMVSQE